MGTIRLFKVWLVIALMVLSGGSLAYAQTNTFPSSGDVGIGTTGPIGKLHIFQSVDDNEGGLYITATTGAAETIRLWHNGTVGILGEGTNSTMSFSNTGNVGIGTTSPRGKLHIIQSEDANDAALYITATTGFLNTIRLWHNGTVGMLGEGTATAISFDGDGQVGIGTTSPSSKLHVAGDAAINGNVGIGTTSPGAKLHVSGKNLRLESGTNEETRLELYSGFTNSGARNWAIQTNEASFGDIAFKVSDAKGGNPETDGSVKMVISSAGNLGIGTTSPTSKLHVAGNARITGDLTTDGNIAAKYQDVAEWVRTPVKLAPGTVVVIDPLESNRVLPSSQSYDTRVAGVVSSRPGIILGEAGEDKAKVAHSGRVKVKAEAQSGPIGIGDLLVSSSTPGHAMVSKPVEVSGVAMHRPGTIVGKALEPLKEGEGEILVLLTLQ